MFKVSKSVLGDVLKNKLMEEALETVQDVVNHVVESFPAISAPEEHEKVSPSIFKHVLSLR